MRCWPFALAMTIVLVAVPLDGKWQMANGKWHGNLSVVSVAPLAVRASVCGDSGQTEVTTAPGPAAIKLSSNHRSLRHLPFAVLHHLPFAVCHLPCSLQVAVASAADDAPTIESTDPYVLLDAAKLSLADSKLEKAGRMLEAIPLDHSQPYVDEEILFQRILLEGSFLSSTTFLLETLARDNLATGKYGQWLASQRLMHGQRFAALTEDYLKRTEKSYNLSFVRFRLPEVNEEHLRDVELYSDPQVLLAAAKNWEEGREGLGKGLVLSQARVAVVLAAAVHYDLAQASTTLMGASRRLAAGVPLRPALLLDWVANTAQRNARSGDHLGELALKVDLRLLSLPAAQLPAETRRRAELRRNPPPPPPPPTVAKPAKKKGRKR